MRQVLLTLCALLSLAACSSKAPVQSGVTLPLRIEAKMHDGKYALFLNDETSPTTTDALKVVLEEYAGVVDPGSGMNGHDPRYQSENPVIFHAPPDAPTELFSRVLELLVNAFLVKVWAELRREGLVPLQCCMELPRDESMGPRRDHRLVFEAVADGAIPEWQVYGAGKRTELERDLSLRVPMIEEWKVENLAAQHESLLRAAKDVSEGLVYHDARIVWKRSVKSPTWGQVYSVLAVLAEFNDLRCRERRSIINTWVGESLLQPEEPEEIDAPSNSFEDD